ncbi:hypothetical protein [Actinomadura algeriensis]|uniref:Uncharacterized protein n=1 Tax=Actinomadura algeriensis TaxID=1679523 RepID=A0ABR9K492_9ACTN|nr:hypothetical protein [Actinomadura algeriensis]MBE1537662.1 hypothetical protein [Actinomadura algeriensis]
MITPFHDESAAMFRALDGGETAEFRSSLSRVFRLSPQVPLDERAALAAELAPRLSAADGDLELVADLAVLAGALVEGGVEPGTTGVRAVRLLHAWSRSVDLDRESGGRHGVGRRLGLAAKTMLTGDDVRAAVRADEDLLRDLLDASRRLMPRISEYREVRRLLKMAQAVDAVVLDRRSGRGFRVAFDGVWTNFQLHTLLADALVGEQGRGLEGERPCPGCVAIDTELPLPPPDRNESLPGVWSLWDHEGVPIAYTGSPADFGLCDGERVIVLDEEPVPEAWEPGVHRHRLVRATLTVEAELTAEAAAARWSRITVPEQI